jgi:hypothetical protein
MTGSIILNMDDDNNGKEDAIKYTYPKGKGKKLSLFLNKHHAVKTYRGSGDIAPRILDLGTRWR